MGLASEAVSLSASRQVVQTDNLLRVCVHDRDKGKRVAVEVRVRITVSGILGKAETLEVSAVLSTEVESTIRPKAVSELPGEIVKRRLTMAQQQARNLRGDGIRQLPS